MSLSGQGCFMTVCPVFLSSGQALLPLTKGRLAALPQRETTMEWTLDLFSGVGWGWAEHGKGLQKSAQPDLRCRPHRRHSGNGPSGAGWKTNRAQAVVTGSQGQLDVNARAPREQRPRFRHRAREELQTPDAAGAGASPGKQDSRS